MQAIAVPEELVQDGLALLPNEECGNQTKAS